ncbi:MAG: peptidoglycan-binding protein [Firmicutes bacterium]|nr:peptidoglycan-binding protein [Bacillota bacterium]
MGLSLVPVAELPPGRRYLRLGTAGRDVLELQKTLARMGFFPGGPHGRYDFLTREAVKNFQRAFHLAADGVVGPKTWRMLGEPGIWSRLCHRPAAGETLTELAARYGVSSGAWKDPASRRRIKRLLPGELLLLEKRELWLAEEELRPGDGVICTRVLSMAAPAGQTKGSASGGTGPWRVEGYGPFKLRLLKVSLPPAATGKDAAGGVVADLRNTGGIQPGRRIPRKVRKELRVLRQNCRGEIFWWLAAGDWQEKLPKTGEADGILYSVNAGPWLLKKGSRAGSAVDSGWRREVKNLLARYPCTRVILHFDLRSREIGPGGELRLVPAGFGRSLRLFQPGRRQRLADGWLLLQKGHGEEEYRFFIADRKTLREIFSGVDRLNLRGVLFTGIHGLEGALSKEAVQFFLVLSQARS